ncbi:MAG: HflC protein [Candidatus Marinimicrobia bacterium]|nr:HflC protein [Candidatus Neomarinimicrobiota bacterium]|tara:strand:+ start:57 stop:1001 length:945 start_codon:yes stop_codon:yes gene_type:complete
MNKLIPIIIVLLLFGLSSSLYTVNEAEQAIILRFGEPVSEKPIDQAGLHFKFPVINSVYKFDKRILEWDGKPEEIPTKDNKYIYIDSFARWIISDPLKFYKSAKNEMIAQSLLDDIIDGAVRNEITGKIMEEIVRFSDRELPKVSSDYLSSNNNDAENIVVVPGARKEISQNILNSVSKKLLELDIGITVIDVQLKRIDYNSRVQQDLFNRMITFQNTIAEKYRAQGRGQKEEILGQQIQKEKEILSSSYLDAQKIRGEADAEAVKIYANSYSKAPDFYNFIETLNAYSETIDSTTSLILSSDNKFLKYLNLDN